MLVGTRLEVSGDLRLFMPTPVTGEQRLLIDELGDGPGARLLLVALADAEPAALARISHAMRAALQESDAFEAVANGEFDQEAIPPRLLPYRYLLTSSFDATPLDAAVLRAALGERLEDLASPAGGMVEDLIARDPTLETLALAEAWQPSQQPQRIDGVWFDAAGRQALLLAQTRAAGFDPDAQQATLDALRRAFDDARGDGDARMTVSGPGAFSVLMRGRTAGEAGTLGGVATLGMIVLLLVAYRAWRIPLLGALPLASAALVGLAAVSLVFGGIHGITLAFGFTLIGVAQDYPVHLFSHRRPGVSARQDVRRLWPTLLTGVVSTCLAYLAFFVSGVDGLRQLGLFTIAGLLTAALCTRYLLPPLLGEARRDVGDSALLGRAWDRLAALPRPRWLAPALGLAALGVILLSPRPWWENNLAALTPVPADLLARDAALRGELGAPDVRWMLVVAGADAEAVLVREEALRAELDALAATGAVDAYDLAADYLPSTATQRARRARLPDRDALETALAEAGAGLPFRADAFAGFVDDVQAARQAPPLTPATVEDTPLAVTVENLLLRHDGASVGLVTLSGVRDADALAAFAAAAGDDVRLLDLKSASESLVVAYRERVLAALGVSILLLVATVAIALRRPRRMLRVLAPVLLSMLAVVALLHAAGVAFNLFHIVALILGAGLGLDYALFFEHAGGDRGDQVRTFHAILVCSLSTLLVFALLGLSGIPVLRAIGTTVGLAVVFNFALALLLARAPAPREAAPR
ncbi:MMPL family transporter [Coralloluteibacterium stylophorae]|uniref:MMPL family transporter n=2 Tax=Coralloluteibacterium stylophorae TaxID=1776034 RepID=A0A8J7VSU7_9GAMM|nr:MMPL family transporter [Coralloluteibacterium stylophorae]MBS7458751.1 MMPL family transporter [Coralloluteibacterium stylophorae]